MSLRSPRKTSAPDRAKVSAPLSDRLSPTIWWPARMSSGTRWEPMKPGAVVRKDAHVQRRCLTLDHWSGLTLPTSDHFVTNIGCSGIHGSRLSKLLPRHLTRGKMVNDRLRLVSRRGVTVYKLLSIAQTVCGVEFRFCRSTRRTAWGGMP